MTSPVRLTLGAAWPRAPRFDEIMARRDPWYRQAADLVLDGNEKNGVCSSTLCSAVHCVAQYTRHELRHTLTGVSSRRSAPLCGAHSLESQKCGVAASGVSRAARWAPVLATEIAFARTTFHRICAGDPVPKEELTAAIIKWYGEVNPEASVATRKVRRPIWYPAETGGEIQSAVGFLTKPAARCVSLRPGGVQRPHGVALDDAYAASGPGCLIGRFWDGCYVVRREGGCRKWPAGEGNSWWHFL